MLLLAMDRAPSARSFDKNGRLHVAVSNISKANVCPYLGREIPEWQALGLDADRIYQLLRDPEELRRALPSFNNLPILSEHVPVTAFGEDSHGSGLVVGSTGTNAMFDGRYVNNSLVVWAKPSIDGIVNDEKRELSSAYWYRADMTPGNYEGVDYDGVMRDIVGNHVALVIEGRAGSDVVVGDEKPMILKSRRALMVSGAVAALVRPKIAQDAKLDISGALKDVNAKSLGKDGAVKSLADKIFGLAQPHLAADAKLTVDEVQVAIALAQDAASGDDADDEMGEDEDLEAGKPGGDKPKPKVAKDEKDDKPAMDEATVTSRIAAAEERVRTEQRELRVAEREVQPIVGELPAMDSAADIYKVGLDALNVDTAGLDKASYGATFRAVSSARKIEPMAQDHKASATAQADFNNRFPDRVKLVKG